MAKQQNLRAPQTALGQAIDNVIALCEDYVKSRKNNQPFDCNPLHQSLKDLKDQKTQKNCEKIKTTFTIVIIALDGGLKECHSYPFDTCSKREKEAILAKDHCKASIYRDLAEFFMDTSMEYEEFTTNHGKPIQGVTKGAREEVNQLIKRANHNAASLGDDEDLRRLTCEEPNEFVLIDNSLEKLLKKDHFKEN